MKFNIIRISVGFIIYMAAIIFKAPWYVVLIPYFIIGGDVLYKAFGNIVRGRLFDENFLMAIATIGAFCIGESTEAAAVMFFYQIGELFQSYAVGRSRRSISELMDIRPDYANTEKDGELVQTDPYTVNIGDIITVKAGEKIPLDGVVISGNSVIDVSALTGESAPVDIEPGSAVFSGSVNRTGLIRIQVTNIFEESTASKILDMVENAGNRKTRSENFITKFARYYTPAVVVSAILLAVIPSLITGEWSVWIKRAVILIFLSCPCALVVSIPLSFFGGIGGASRNGILIKGGNYIETLAKTSIVVFDKTGTLTEGKFSVVSGNEKAIEYAAYAETYSDHPIALSIAKAYGKSVDKTRIQEVEEITGHGIIAVIDGMKVLAGNMKLMQRYNIAVDDTEILKNGSGTVVYVAVGGEYIGSVAISDKIKKESRRAVENLRNIGIKKTVMLTGDRKSVGETVAGEIGIDEFYAELLPNEKVGILEKYIKEGITAFVGDGINDAPALSRSDIGIAMGGMGSDTAVEAADIVIMDDNPDKVSTVCKIARKTLSVVKQNIILALGIKFGVIALGIFGLAGMQLAVFADVGVSVIAILNAMRCLKNK